jgi:hypothetical protein
VGSSHPLVDVFLSGTLTDPHGAIRRMTSHDVLIVAPQVGRFRRALRHGRIGTVDKFRASERRAVI